MFLFAEVYLIIIFFLKHDYSTNIQGRRDVVFFTDKF